MLPWLLCALCAAFAAVLLLRLRLLQASLSEIHRQLGEILSSDTNALLLLPGRDPHARRLAAALNEQLRQLRAARRRYENGDRELKEAVTNVSHDLRTPLAAACGYLELLERRTSDSDSARYLAQINSRLDAMKQLTQELLHCSVALSTGEELRLEPVDLNAAVEENLAGLYASLVARGIAPQVSLPQARVLRNLDRAALDRVLGNLLANALKYSTGDLEVTLSPVGALTFTNTAPGLDPVQVGRLFDRFFTLETARSSGGLGLSIAKSLTERMGGSLCAGYRGEKLSFTLSFPP